MSVAQKKTSLHLGQIHKFSDPNNCSSVWMPTVYVVQAGCKIKCKLCSYASPTDT